MNSDAASRRKRGFKWCCGGLLLAALHSPWTYAEEPTWRTLDQLSAEDLAAFDPATDAPRDAKVAYLPAEPYPFQAPYTAEEMGYRAAEFAHIARWPQSLVDVFGVITGSGYINQGVGVSYVWQSTAPGLASYIHDLPAGQEYSRWLVYSTFPPQSEAEPQLWIPYRTDATHRTKMDFFIYSPELRRVRRQPQPRRDQRFPDNAQTFDDVIGRDPWEFQWQLVGTDVVHQTVRFPDTRPTITFNVAGKGFVEVPTGAIKPLGNDYPFYRPDGGVDCWVVKATTREDLLPDYNEKTLVYWLDKHYFYPVRMEKYNAKGELIMIEVIDAQHSNTALPDGFGYAALISVYWDLEHDIMSYSLHDAVRPHPWTAEQSGMIFTPEFMRREWLVEPIKSQTLIDDPKQYFLRPQLYEGRFPDLRKIAIPADLLERVQAQEAAGHLVFGAAAEPSK